MRRVHQGFDYQLGCLGYGWLLSLLVVAWGGTPVAAQPFAYATQESSVAVINTAINSVVATIPVASPHKIAITPDGAFAQVTQDTRPPDSSDTVVVLDTATHAVRAMIPVAGGVEEIAITPDGAFAQVTSGFGSNTVAVINTATNTVVATIPVGNGPQGVVISPDGSYVYVVSFWREDVSVIATVSNTVVATIRVGRDPFGIAITPDGAFAYVDSGAVLETATNTVVARRDLPSARAAFTPDGTRGYVPAAAGVAVIDPKILTVLSTIPLQREAGGIAIPTTTPRLGTQCPVTSGFWKTHADAWPLTVLTLGSQTYTQAELLALLNMPVRGDASLILANQLLAAKLNIAAGADPTPIRAVLQEADGLLSQGFAGKLPYHVDPSSPTGQRMVEEATVFESYNIGDLTATCQPAQVSAR